MDVDPIRWVQLGGAVMGAVLLCLGLYIQIMPLAWIGGVVLAISGWCVSSYNL
jgi:putative effector of murein hydrolase LrgA (UPF0299 family)